MFLNFFFKVKSYEFQTEKDIKFKEEKKKTLEHASQSSQSMPTQWSFSISHEVIFNDLALLLSSYPSSLPPSSTAIYIS